MLSPVLLILCSSTWRRALIIHKIDYRLSKLQHHKIQFDSVLKTSNEFDWWTTLGGCPFYWERGPRQQFSRVNKYNLKLEYMSGEHKSVPLFWNGSLKLNGKDNFILNLHDLIRPEIWRRPRALKRNYFDFELGHWNWMERISLCAFQYHYMI